MPISNPYEDFKRAPSGYFSDAEIERYRPKTGFKNDKFTSFFNYGQSGSTEKKGGLEQAGNLAKQFLEKSEKRRERDEMIAAYSRMAAQPFGGAGLAGAATGALGGAATGAKIGAAGGPIGAGVGALIGALGGFFG